MKKVKKIIVALVMMLTITTVIPICISKEGITVEAAAKVKLNMSSAYVVKGSTIKLSIKGTTKKVQWKSSNSKIATVNSKGIVKGIKKGTTTITAKVSGKSYKCKVTVETPSLNKKSAIIYSGETVTLKLKNTKQKITWKSSNKDVAVINNKGIVKGIKKGTVNITAQVGNKKFACVVTVKKPYVAVKSISISEKKITLEKGKTHKLKAVVSPSNASDTKITWTTSDKNIASIDSKGTVTAKSAGIVTVTAKVGKKSATCRVIVNENIPISSNVKKLKTHIDMNGDVNSNYDRFIKWNYNYSGDQYAFAIVHELNTDMLKFIYTRQGTDTQSSLTMYVDIENDKNVSPNYTVVFSTYYLGANAEATFDATQYVPDDNVHFSLISSVGIQENDIQNLANSELSLALEGWDVLLQNEVGITLKDIGFLSYE